MATSKSFNGRMRDELLNESLFFGLDHARSAIAEWRQDFNTARPHSSLTYQTPAAFAGTLAATGYAAPLDMGFASPPVAQPAPYGVTETAEALIAADCAGGNGDRAVALIGRAFACVFQNSRTPIPLIRGQRFQ